MTDRGTAAQGRESAQPGGGSRAMVVLAAHGFAACPPADACIVTGGAGWVVVASVCTGAMILAAAGLLDGHRATTKRAVTGAEVPPIAILRENHPAVRVVTARVVDEDGRRREPAIDLTLH